VGQYHLKASRRDSVDLRNIAGLSPDGTKAMVLGPTGAIYDLPTGVEILGVPGPGGRRPIPSPDLKTVICFERALDLTSKARGAVWDLEGQKKLAEIEIGSRFGSVAAALSPSGERLVVAEYVEERGRNSRATTVITGWDIKTGKKLGTVEDAGLGEHVQIAAASETTAIISSTKGKPRRIDFERGQFGDEIESPQNSPYQPTPIVFSPDRKHFALGVGLEEPGAFGVQLHEWPSAKTLHTFKSHAGAVSALRFSADGTLLASGSEDGTVLVWDLSVIGK
jgi:WD40 repeat protein